MQYIYQLKQENVVPIKYQYSVHLYFGNPNISRNFCEFLLF